ncbi:zinc-dependent alcohol dehydrogenase family protein [Acetatifactor muris]|uniref:Sorbitol dehydrogenase n=1 Tax=Acetatifactor muris TaxID=879566 RepID=A0A2K4ZP20_9FIRM|nr:zinc-dependent alcohol dehydrogenase family protein [Acetatifactor muris]MCR2050711.1 zinc-dependent alcohol dehydrogenase family protein [Acetatifactor muris]SOY32227.1 Sorbitol dehydrogenase [Acetatifactor muris]
MKAAVFQGKGKIVIQERPIPELRDHEVLIRVAACGVCGTDVHIYGGEKGSAEVNPPVVLGHEFAGTVAAAGKAVTMWKVGDKAAVDPNIYCGKCEMCHRGKKNLCEALSAVGVTRDGGFEEYCVVPETQCYRLEEGTDLLCGAMAEPLSCCLHGMEMAAVRPGDHVCIIGGGAIGLIMLQLARLAGAATVSVSEPVEIRRKVAGELGADYVIDPLKESPGEMYRQMPGGGADVVIECAGVKAAAKQAFEAAGKGGKIVFFSVPAPDARIELPLFELYQKEWHICGSFINPDTFARAVALINNRKIHFEKIITHTYEIQELEQAILMQAGRESLKVVVKG